MKAVSHITPIKCPKCQTAELYRVDREGWDFECGNCGVKLTFIEVLEQRAEQQSFNKNILGDIQELKNDLEHKIFDFRVKGDFHRLSQTKELLVRLEAVEKAMKRLVGDSC